MATLLSVTNRVLRRLREDTVTATTESEYAGLVAEFVSEIHQEIINAHAWEFFKKTVTCDVVAGQRQYDLSAEVASGGSVQNGTPTARFDASLRVNAANQAQAWYFRDETGPYGWQMFYQADDDIRRLYQQNTDIEQDWPSHFSLTNDGEKLYLNFAWAPLGADAHFQLDMMSEPDLLESDGTDDSTNIVVPERPLYLGALYLALNERGEEIGEPGNMAQSRYYDALGAAIEKDQKHDELTNQMDWYRG